MFFQYPKVHTVTSDKTPFGDVQNHCVQYTYYTKGSDKVTGTHEGTHGINSQLNKDNLYGFYLLQDRAIQLAEPTGKKSECIKFIPPDMRYGRFNTYIRGQTAFENQPLYVFDEWAAYRNGATHAVEAQDKSAKNSDFLFAPIEMATYGIATVMAHPRQDLIEFLKFLLDDVLQLYVKGKTMFPWPQADKCFEQLRTNRAFRDFLGNFIFPGEAQEWVM